MSGAAERARRNYDRLARWYDWIGASEQPLVRAGLALLAAQPGERALEIGVGTGQALAALARSVGGAGCAFGIDISPLMLARSRRRLLAAAAAERALAVRADARSLPIGDGRCDAVFSSFALELLAPADLAQALAECRRVLRDDGRMAVVTMASRPRPGALDRLYEAARVRWPETIDCRPIDIAEQLTAAGFRIERVEPRRLWGLSVDLALARR